MRLGVCLSGAVAPFAADVRYHRGFVENKRAAIRYGRRMTLKALESLRGPKMTPGRPHALPIGSLRLTLAGSDVRRRVVVAGRSW